MMPVVFIGHGSPANALEDNESTRAWHRIVNSMERPKAILVISAHWYTHGCAVTAMESRKQSTISARPCRRRYSTFITLRRGVPNWRIG